MWGYKTDIYFQHRKPSNLTQAYLRKKKKDNTYVWKVVSICICKYKRQGILLYFQFG